VSLWVRGLPEKTRAVDVFVRIDGRELPSVFVSEPDARGLRQVNALLPAGMPTGPAELNLAAGSSITAPVRVEITR
jgi:uncharacterized protein (TIGR03437 family)